MKDITVSIVTWNSENYILKCIDSVFFQKGPFSFEVYVIDNNSSDNTCKVAIKEFPNIGIVKNGYNLGYGRANNIVFGRAEGRYFLLLNPDVILKENALMVLFNFMEKNLDVGIAGPRILNGRGRIRFEGGRAFPNLFNELCEEFYLSRLFGRSAFFGSHLMRYWGHDTIREVDVLSGACMMIRRESITQPYLFDRNYRMFFEDIDLCFQIKKMGWKIFYLPEAEVVHIQGASTDKIEGQMLIELNKSRIYFYKKNYNFNNPTILKLSFFLGAIFRLISWTPLCLMPGLLKKGKNHIKGYLKLISWFIKGE